MELIRQIMTLVLGYKYYLVVLQYCNAEHYGVNETVFADTPAGRKNLEAYLKRLEWNQSYRKAEVVSFRSRLEYAEILAEKMKDEQEQPRAL